MTRGLTLVFHSLLALGAHFTFLLLLEAIIQALVLDAGMIAAAQAVERYEIARYGTLIAWAEQLGNDEVSKLLQETLKEEKHADEILNKIAMQSVNWKAA